VEAAELDLELREQLEPRDRLAGTQEQQEPKVI
jgi:hypothetical protein